MSHIGMDVHKKESQICIPRSGSLTLSSTLDTPNPALIACSA
jgi:hypothetical protein